MKRWTRGRWKPLLCALVLTAAAQVRLAGQAQDDVNPAADNPVVVIETSKGTISVELWPEAAPETVANFLYYVDTGFYKDTIFHRVIEDTLIQGGGLTPELDRKIAGPPIKIESNNGRLNVRGTIAMARGQENDSATSEFYINLRDNPDFDRTVKRAGYTVFGLVIDGMKTADRIGNVQTSRRGEVADIPILPVYVETIRRAEAPLSP
ncbi:MAG: peptidylprolyl isomerase [Acidobacteria bacterium]|nr:peptidylprolyl isomerase [Acidobacteriota bacterium]